MNHKFIINNYQNLKSILNVINKIHSSGQINQLLSTHLTHKNFDLSGQDIDLQKLKFLCETIFDHQKILKMSMAYCDVDDKIIDYISNSNIFDNLYHVDLAGNQLTNNDLSLLMNSKLFRNVSILNLSDNDSINCSPYLFSKLLSYNIDYFYFIGNRFAHGDFTSKPYKINSPIIMDLSHTNISDEFIISVFSKTSLDKMLEMNLESTKVSLEGVFRLLGQNKSIQKVNISYNNLFSKNITSSDELNYFNFVNDLNLEGCDLNDEQTIDLVKNYNINNAKKINLSLNELSDKFFRDLKYLDKIFNWLDVDFSALCITNESIDSILNFFKKSKINRFSFTTYCDNLDENDFIYLLRKPHLPYLKHIELGDNNLSFHFIKKLLKSDFYKNLSSINLNSNMIDDDALFAMSNTECNLNKLDVSFNKNITIEGISRVLKSENFKLLNELDLRGTSVSHQDIHNLLNQKWIPKKIRNITLYCPLNKIKIVTSNSTFNKIKLPYRAFKKRNRSVGDEGMRVIEGAVGKRGHHASS